MSGQRFSVGDGVRVRPGTTDPDYADLPLGGWAGVVSEIDPSVNPPLYLVEWSDETTKATPKVYRIRCDRDGLDAGCTWLAEDDLERDGGGPVSVEQPAKLTPRPLNLDEPEERALHVLGLSCDDELPPVTLEALERYHGHLAKVLKFPFPAGLDLGGAQIGSGLRPVMVLRVLPAAQSLPVVGLMAEVALEQSRLDVPLAVLEPTPDDPATKELVAYDAWIGDNLPPLPAPPREVHPYPLVAVGSALLGGMTGAAIATVPGAPLGAAIGAALVAVVGFLVGVRYEAMLREGSRLPPGILGGALLGFLAGGGVGAAIGAAAVTFYGAIPGAILGTLLARWRRRWPKLPLVFGGAGLGTLAAALLFDWSEALVGLGWGLLAGALGGALLVAGAWLYLNVIVHYSDEV